MSSFGSGGGAASGSAGGNPALSQAMSGLGLDQYIRQFAQQLGQGMQGTGGAVQPGKMAQMSPQERLASVMKIYGGG